MLTAACFFRGNYMKPTAAHDLVTRVCSVSELAPEYWNVCEPIDIPLNSHTLSDATRAMAPSNQIRSLVFFVRHRPHSLVSIDLRLAPYQGTTPHNNISITMDSPSAENACTLANYICRSLGSSFPDYASVSDSPGQDRGRFQEFRQPYTPGEFANLFAQKRPPVAPFGPYGSLGDVYWFNYFGRVYVDFIGKARLIAAGWARTDEIGNGLACYATDKVGDPTAREKRDRIACSLADFVWTPLSKPEEKRVPVFDFSEQLAALSPEALAKLGVR